MSNFIKEVYQNLKPYLPSVSKWHRYTLDFVNNPIIFDPNQPDKQINFRQISKQNRASILSELLTTEQNNIDVFYRKARRDLYQQKKEFYFNCTSYATFVYSFLKFLDKDSDTSLVFGLGQTKPCLETDEYIIGDDHFWVQVNQKILDNTIVDGRTPYLDILPFLYTQDNLSGEFKFQEYPIGD